MVQHAQRHFAKADTVQFAAQPCEMLLLSQYCPLKTAQRSTAALRVVAACATSKSDGADAVCCAADGPSHALAKPLTIPA